MIFPRHVVVYVDTREVKPLPLPETIWWSEPGRAAHLIHVRAESKKLPAGDYCLKECPDQCIIERKGNINELYQNLRGADRERAMRAFQKLCEATENPILALDFSLTQRLYKDESYRATLMTRLAQLCATYHLQILSVGSGVNARRIISDLIIRTLVAHLLRCPPLGKDKIPCITATQELPKQPTQPKDPNPPPKPIPRRSPTSR